jgi:hypothetical protein
VQYRAMAGQKKILSPDLSRRNKMKPGDKPFAEEWADYKREEKELEERKCQRLAGEKSVNSKD